MRYILLLTSFIFLLQASEVSFSDKKNRKDDSAYTVQLFSAKSIATAKKMVSKVPKNYKKDTHLYKVGNYIAGRYYKNSSYEDIKKVVPAFKESGFLDAYVLKSTTKHMREELITGKTANFQKREKTTTVAKDTQYTKISKYSKSDIILKADSAYKKGNENEAIIYYEMLIASGYKSKKIINNLCYLYGKRGAWFNAKRIIDRENFKGKYLYAYAYGATLSNQKNFYENLSPYIMLDKSGRLMLLSGYYFEKNGDIEKAGAFYKMAYTQNPSDVYMIFSYARSEDIQNRKQEAKELYKKILGKISPSHPLYNSVSLRVSQI